MGYGDNDMNEMLIFIWIMALFSAFISCSIVASSDVKTAIIPPHTYNCHLTNERQRNSEAAILINKAKITIFYIRIYNNDFAKKLLKLENEIERDMKVINNRYYKEVDRCQALRKPKK